ncbi:hypothetical protein PGIGA_G00102890 [Pangasianodon gigas]|uniref:Uncharacterized protein n=1 Tax=Pangasianodon gigas TaxID=30993 RepID=A0ACC5XEN9_PANGG|nr:hypothetical protein [Pangasianodon gigas]
MTPVDQQKKEELEDKDYLSGETSSSVGHIHLIDQQKHVIKEEPEDEDFLCGGISSSVGHVTHEGEQNGEVLKKEIKEEESKDEEYLCATTVCG